VDTLGIDLAAQPANTAACLIRWPGQGRPGVAEPPVAGLDDEALVIRMLDADRIGIDAPFGWPDAFRTAVETWTVEGRWNGSPAPEPLRLRATDLVVRRLGRTPLSVSSDRIAIPAMRCAHVLTLHAQRRGLPLDRVHGAAVEVYPAAALAAWGLDSRGYKKPEAVDQRRALARALTASTVCLLADAEERCAARPWSPRWWRAPRRSASPSRPRIAADRSRARAGSTSRSPAPSRACAAVDGRSTVGPVGAYTSERRIVLVGQVAVIVEELFA
jgi:hypothetical protein